ncbi:MAG: ABC transporter ATP-binding protein [Clostridiaceae bacterium]|nr:ABC transporter ATP-binding protein [Bacillota bacterium]NLI38486.1 ABC transporter ATP-binding protein [Clostridiaceae bacterium]
MKKILQVQNLTKEFKGFKLDNISLSMEKGYIMGFIGPNGAGKSTTIKLIMNLLRKDAGEILVFGKDNIRHEKEIKNRIGFVYDENYYYEELTPLQMKRVFAPLYKNWDDNAFTNYMRRFELPLNKQIKDLSKGMKMKYSLAIALSHNADLLIMDEPTSGLDPIVRRELLDILTSVSREEDKGVFFSTHITSDLDRVADFITFINEGKVVFSSAKDDILENYCLVKGANGLIGEEEKKNFIGIRENRFGFEGLAMDRKNIRKMLGESIVIEKPTLDDIMLYFARRNQDA